MSRFQAQTNAVLDEELEVSEQADLLCKVTSLPRLVLTDDEVQRLASVLDAPFAPPTALRASLARLADPHRAPPRVRWL